MFERKTFNKPRINNKKNHLQNIIKYEVLQKRVQISRPNNLKIKILAYADTKNEYIYAYKI